MNQIDWLGLWQLSLNRPERQLEGWGLLGLYALVLALSLWSTRRTWHPLKSRRLLLFLALCLSALILNNILAWHYPVARPPVPNRPQEASGWPSPLLGSLPILITGAWWGLGPALVVGVLSGLMRALFIQAQVPPIFEFAVLGLIAAFLLRQDYVGRFFAFLRQPIVAGVFARLLIWPLTFPGIYMYAPDQALYALDFAWPLFTAGFLPALVEGVLAGLIVQALYAARPAMRPVQDARAAPPFSKSLNRRLLFTFVPIMLVMVAVPMYAVMATTINAATRQAVQQMARDAASATQDIPFFFQTGQNLVTALSNDADLRSNDANIRQSRLAEGVRTGAFFDELALTDASGQVSTLFPSSGSKQLTSDEKTLVSRTVSSGAPGISEVQRVTTDTLRISFVVPLDDSKGVHVGAVVGRARLNANPMMVRALTGLQNTLGTGEGFVVDERGRIVLVNARRADRLTTDWRMAENQPVLSQVGEGKVYVSSVEDGTRRLIYVRPVLGTAWTSVIELPYASVLGLAADVSAPMLVLLLTIMLMAGIAGVAISRRVTRPLRQLAQATAQIAEGRLESPVLVRGQDEVGQLGEAFEDMRASLKGRLEDLSLLVHVSQAVAGSLDLERGIPPILEAAMESSGARAVRLLLFERGSIKSLWRRGDLPGEILPMDRYLAGMAEPLAAPWWVDSVARARNQIEPSLVPAGVRALAALPIRRLKETIGVLWVAFAEPHHRTDTEKNILATLAGQADVLVENARLFQTAENERQRLAAILISTSDAVIVTSPDDRVLLMNPAAEIAFGVVATRVVGKRLQETVLDASVIQLLTTQPIGAGPQTGEIILPDSRTLYGSASVIKLENGPSLGRVAVMRDITKFKELDAMKTDFVATVSHDLRSPLTYMRGYTAMLPMVGELSPKQSDYVAKIQHGIEQMTELIDDLLDMSRIEAGVGLQRVECEMAEIVNTVFDEARGRAMAFGLELVTAIHTHQMLVADPALIRRAVSNLVDNAIKYTPPGGTITMGVEIAGASLVVRVSDTGLGIAPEDQVRLFEKFYRVKRRETVDIKGSGLGLAIVKSIVEWHNGRVWVESQPGSGATFYIALPIKSPVSGESEPT